MCDSTVIRFYGMRNMRHRYALKQKFNYFVPPLRCIVPDIILLYYI